MAQFGAYVWTARNLAAPRNAASTRHRDDGAQTIRRSRHRLCRLPDTTALRARLRFGASMCSVPTPNVVDVDGDTTADWQRAEA